ncbi:MULTISPECIES: LysR substrate-binding domain-containing protein [Marinobacter]|uniref:LysR substrate-binding domain-containing protein n=1 Tax=Marinobacter TaxID=2742 RepID=UPI001902F32C|nr:hypothetical protein [Marinobacter sp. DY40_1A1]
MRVGYSASAIFSKTLTSVLADLLANRPMPNLELHKGNALFHIASLKAGKLDAGVPRADLDEGALSGLLVSRLGNEPLFVILNRGHRLQEKSVLGSLMGSGFASAGYPKNLSEATTGDISKQGRNIHKPCSRGIRYWHRDPSCQRRVYGSRTDCYTAYR